MTEPSGTGRRAADTARDQVARMLALVPYLHAAAADTGEVRVEDAARALEVTPAQVDKDLRVLFMCGLPGGYPDDLIDVDIDALDEGVIRVSNADYLARPVRFAPAEATALVVALRALAEGADEATGELVRRTLARIEGAASDSAAGRVHLADAGQEDDEASAQVIRTAIDGGRQLRLRYYVPTRDEESERVVDPWLVRRDEGAGYLDAWCHSAGGHRMFRLDRIHRATVLDTPLEHPAPESWAPEGPWFEQASTVTLRLAPEAAWVPEYYATTGQRDLPDGGQQVDLEVADPAWLHQLLLRVAPHASVVGPREFADSFTAHARDALGLYDTPA